MYHPWNHRWQFFLRLFSLLLVLGGSIFAVRPAFAQNCPLYPAPRDRFGFNMTLEPKQPIEAYDVGKLYFALAGFVICSSLENHKS